jgi:hypothetical protein
MSYRNRSSWAIHMSAALFLCSCAAEQKTDVNEDFSDLAGLDQKSDKFSSKLKLLGTLEDSTTSAAVKYSSNPKFLGYQFLGTEGDDVSIWVRSKDGDAIAWLLDSKYNVIVKNDDEGMNNSDAYIHTLLTKTENNIYYIVFRELDQERASFTVTLQGATIPSGNLSGRDAFDKLSSLEKMKRLYADYKENAEYGNFYVSDEFKTRTADKLADVLEGDALKRAQAAYDKITKNAKKNGGDAPEITAIVNKTDGLTYAYELATGGRSYGNWAHSHVFDYLFLEEIGDFGWSD